MTIDDDGIFADCRGCDTYDQVNDLGLCTECTAKLERDLIRARDWEYSVTAFGVPRDEREALREEVIAKFGKKNELVVDETADEKGGKKKKGKKKKQKKSPRSG